jgi:hypothetical protein
MRSRVRASDTSRKKKATEKVALGCRASPIIA